MRELEQLLDSAQAYEFRGTQAAENGEWEAATRLLRRGVELAPDEPSIRVKLADVLRRSGSAEESLRHYERAVTIDPGLTGARFGHAMALVRLRRYQEAQDRLTEGMKAHPSTPAFAKALARVLAAAPDERVRDGHRALAITHELLKQEQDTDLGETMAMALAAVGQFDEAATLQRALIATVQRSGREDLLRAMNENLQLYVNRMPCRTPWRDDAMP
jgi:tetratricopeptide (TPR) repeat protein